MGDSSGGVVENVVPLDGITIRAGIKIGNNGEHDVGEMVLLNEDLSTHARVDSGSWDITVTVGEHVASTESKRWETRVDVDERVVVVGDAELATILRGVAIGVADEGALPLLIIWFISICVFRAIEIIKEILKDGCW